MTFFAFWIKISDRTDFLIFSTIFWYYWPVYVSKRGSPRVWPYRNRSTGAETSNSTAEFENLGLQSQNPKIDCKYFRKSEKMRKIRKLSNFKVILATFCKKKVPKYLPRSKSAVLSPFRMRGADFVFSLILERETYFWKFFRLKTQMAAIISRWKNKN